MITPQAWKGEAIREPLTLVGRHVRLEPLVPSHAPDRDRAGDAPDIWLYLAVPRGQVRLYPTPPSGLPMCWQTTRPVCGCRLPSSCSRPGVPLGVPVTSSRHGGPIVP